MIGLMILQYRILSWLGAGSSGEVYLAEDTKLGCRRVALKILSAEVARDAERVRRFHREAEAASALNHPNIVTIYDAGQDGDLHFIVTEYIEGENLHERLMRGPLSPDETLRIGESVADALDAAHGAGIVHGDLNPLNIMLGKRGVVKVIDFGLAKLAGGEQPAAGDRDGETKVSAPDVVEGTPDYISPEQLRGEDADGRSDSFSLGVCLHEMLTGRSPFRRPTVGGTIDAILRDDLPPLGEGVPALVRAVVLRALQKEREARYQSAQEFRQDLSDVRRALPQVITMRLPRPPAARRSRHAIRVALALLLAVVVGGVWYRFSYPSGLVAQGRKLMGDRTGNSLIQAKERCARALLIDERNVRALVCLAEIHTLMEEYMGVPSKESLPEARRYVTRALEINPNSAEARAAEAFIYMKLRMWDDAERAFKHSIHLNPRYALAHQRYGSYLRIVGRHLDALIEMKIAHDLAPADKMIRVNVIISYIMVGDREKAIKEGKELLDLHPTFWGARSWVAIALMEQGEAGKIDALSDMEVGVQHSNRSHTLVANQGHMLARYGETARAESILRELEDLHRQGKGMGGQNMAKVYAGLGRLDEAIDWLEKDYAAASGDLPNISWHPAFKPLRGHPRFDDLLRRLNLQPQPAAPVKRDDRDLAGSQGGGGGLPLIKQCRP